MYLRAVGRRFTQMNAYVLVMNSKRCNEAPFRCAAICISVIYRRLLQKLLPSELLEVFFFLIALCSLSAFDDRVCNETTQKNKNDNLWITWGGEVVAKLSGMSTNWIMLLFLFVTAEKTHKVG